MTHNTDDFEDDDLDPAERQGLLREKIRTEGAEAAYAALLGVCRDAKAPAPAKATAGVALLRAGGYLEKQEAGPEKELYQMSAAELDRGAKRIERELKAAKARAKAGGDDEPVFE